MVRVTSGKVEKSGKMCFACGVLPRLRWSQNKHSLTARVLLSADDMSVMDWQRSTQKLILPLDIVVIMSFKVICILSPVCRKHLEKSGKSRAIWWGLESGHPVNLSTLMMVMIMSTSVLKVLWVYNWSYVINMILVLYPNVFVYSLFCTVATCVMDMWYFCSFSCRCWHCFSFFMQVDVCLLYVTDYVIDKSHCVEHLSLLDMWKWRLIVARLTTFRWIRSLSW